MVKVPCRVHERIAFPGVGLTIQVLQIDGPVALLGIDAPPSLQMQPQESAELDVQHNHGAASTATHELCNRLSHITLALHLFERQRLAGQVDEADATLAQVFAAMNQLDRNTIDSLLTTTK